MNPIWILTTRFNDYDQHGSYFVAAFPYKPTHDEFYEWWFKGGEVMNEEIAHEFVDHVLAGGGRRDYEYQWYTLEEYKFGTKYDD